MSESSTLTNKYLKKYIHQGDENKATYFSPEFEFEEIKELEDDVFCCSGMPLHLRKGERYLIIAWDTNWMVDGVESNTFKVVDKQGSDLSCTKKYFMVYN